MSVINRLEGLLLSSDAQMLRTMKKVLDQFAIETEVCTDLASALAAVNGRRLDAVILDWSDAENACETSSAVRRSQLNHTVTIFALVTGKSELEAATRTGATFMIQKPVAAEQLTRGFRAAYSAILLRRRSAARVPVQIATDATVTGLDRIKVKITDLSVGGLALQSEPALRIGAEVSLGFPLPGTMSLVHAIGKVVNTDGKSTSGVCFTFIPPTQHNILQSWLTTQFTRWASQELVEVKGTNPGGVLRDKLLGRM